MAMNDIPEVAVVIVNWNKKDDVINLLTELENISKPGFDVFVVDNASEDDSVAAIRAKFPRITLIINPVNTGGTGGFNRGIKYVIGHKKYRYVWLLDNDTSLDDKTLSELFNVMESDSRIGIAGSRIVDIENRVMTVETGGNFRWDIIGVIPVNRNTKKDFERPFETIDVDYVAICSALIRVEALEQVGLMDDRLFLFWDDMDWGLCFKEKGFKVVAVPKSIIYHNSFTERDRGAITNYYYGLRNALLVYSKHTNFKRRALIFYRALKYNLRVYRFLKMHNQKYNPNLMVNAFGDFCNNNWGKLVAPVGNKEVNNSGNFYFQTIQKKTYKNILVIVNNTSYKDNVKMLKQLEKIIPEALITVLVHDDRANYYVGYNTYKLKRNKLSSLIYLFNIFVRLRHEKFDCVASITPSPFMYIANQAIFFSRDDQKISFIHTGTAQFLKLCLSLCWGEILALILLPVLMLKSLQYTKGIKGYGSRHPSHLGLGRDEG